MLNQFDVTELNCRLIVFKEQCLIGSLSTQGMVLWDFFQGKGPLVTEEKVCNCLQRCQDARVLVCWFICPESFAKVAYFLVLDCSI